MPTIIANKGIVTQINVFDVLPGKGDGLIALLRESAHAARIVPGWLSASLHRSLDGRTVVNYAQSTDMAAQEQVLAVLRDGGFLARNKAFGTAHPHLCEVVCTLER